MNSGVCAVSVFVFSILKRTTTAAGIPDMIGGPSWGPGAGVLGAVLGWPTHPSEHPKNQKRCYTPKPNTNPENKGKRDDFEGRKSVTLSRKNGK